MKLLTILLAILVASAGGGYFAGSQRSNREFLRGRLTACVDFMGPIAANSGVPFVCKIENNEVIVIVEGTPIKLRLDGTPLN